MTAVQAAVSLVTDTDPEHAQQPHAGDVRFFDRPDDIQSTGFVDGPDGGYGVRIDGVIIVIVHEHACSNSRR